MIMYCNWSVVAPKSVAENLVASVALLEVALKFPVAVNRGGGETVAVALPHMWRVNEDRILHGYHKEAVVDKLPWDGKFPWDLCVHMAGHRAPKRAKLEEPAFIPGDSDDEVEYEAVANPFWVGDDRYDANGMRVYE
jgi:hypothetical protein